MKDTELKNEYQLFQDAAASVPVPKQLEQTVLKQVERKLQPTAKRVLSKFAAIHVVSSLLTLSFCPQFGLGPFFGQHGIMRYFMYFGDLVCIALCGALYLSSTVALAFLLMRPEEWRKLRELALPSFAGVATLSLLAFFSLTQTGFIDDLFWSLGFVLAWFIAALVAAKSTEKLLDLAARS